MDWLSERHAIYVKAQKKSAKTANLGKKGLQRVNNRLFNMDKPMNSLDLTCYL